MCTGRKTVQAECGWKGNGSFNPGWLGNQYGRKGESSEIPFAQESYVPACEAAVKAQDELAALGLDGCLASLIASPTILSKGNFRRQPLQRFFA